MPGPETEIAATAGGSRSHLRASRADREQLIGTLKTAFVQGRLTEDELDARVDLVYASRTYAELADVTVDIPAELTGAKSPRDPWRATKIACRIEYAIFLPGIVAFLLAPGGPRTTAAEMVGLTSIVCLLFWLLGVFMLVASRPRKGSGGQLPPRTAAGAAACAGGGEPLHVSHAVAREQVNRILVAAWEQGRLTEDERDARAAQVSASRCHADLASLVADLPAGLATRPPTTRDVRTGVCVIIAAAGVLAAVLLSNPDNRLAFMAFLFAAATLIVAPVMTVGLIFDVRHQKRSGEAGVTALSLPASRGWGGIVMSGPGDETAAVESRSRGDLRASHADREQVIGTLKAAFVEGRLTEGELDARVDQVYASRTYAELAEVTADIPTEFTRAKPPRDPWRATKVAWGVVYALILPGLLTLIALPGGPGPLTAREVVTVSAIVYGVIWILGVCMMVVSRLGKRSGGHVPPRSAPGAGG